MAPGKYQRPLVLKSKFNKKYHPMIKGPLRIIQKHRISGPVQASDLADLCPGMSE